MYVIIIATNNSSSSSSRSLVGSQKFCEKALPIHCSSKNYSMYPVLLFSALEYTDQGKAETVLNLHVICLK
jgi:hypothetical protein